MEKKIGFGLVAAGVLAVGAAMSVPTDAEAQDYVPPRRIYGTAAAKRIEVEFTAKGCAATGSGTVTNSAGELEAFAGVIEFNDAHCDAMRGMAIEAVNLAAKVGPAKKK